MTHPSLTYSKTRRFRPWLIALNLLLALVPVYRMVDYLLSFGEDNVAIDTFLLLPFLDKILSGTASWKDILLYPNINGHLSTVPLLSLALDAQIFGLSVFPVLVLGLLLGVLQVALVFDAVSWRSCNPLKWFFLPIFSVLVFAPSQICSFEFEQALLSLRFAQLGFFLGIWGISRFPNRWPGALCVCLGGAVATASHGSGPLVWPIFFLGFLGMGFKKLGYFALLFCCGLVSCSPYLYLVLFGEAFQKHPEFSRQLSANIFKAIGLNFVPGQKSPVVSWFNYPQFIEAVGLPLPTESPGALRFRGLAVSAALGLGSLIFLGLRSARKAMVPFLMIGYGLLTIWMVSSFRSSLMIWHTTPFLPLYLGWVGLIFLAVLDEEKGLRFAKAGWQLPGWGLVSLAMLVYLFASSILNLSRNSVFMQFRSPVSASCLRNFEKSPTYCESTLFWAKGHYSYLSNFFSILKKHHWSVFSGKQRWTLQGDYIQDSVKLNESPGIPDIFWSTDLSSKSVPFSDPRHLNLFVHASNSLEWTVRLPKRMESAELNSAIAISRSAPVDPLSDGAIFEISIAEENKPYQLVFSRFLTPEERSWQPLKLSLAAYRGKTVKIKLASQMVKNYSHDWGMFRYPYIDLAFQSDNDESTQTKPINTDLAEQAPRPGPGDFVFDLASPALWESRGVHPSREKTSEPDHWYLQGSPSLQFKVPLDLEISNYSHLYFEFKAPYEAHPLMPKITFIFNGAQGYQSTVTIPALSDEKRHGYTYDLKLLELGQPTRLTGLRVEFTRMMDDPADHEASFANLRLIKKL